ncbi:MAG: response regulator [Myxococcales bacterium]|nr:response regulator [Myxococcales bacterium]
MHRVLLVDDNQGLLDVYGSALEEAGFEVIPLVGAARIIEATREFEPDLILMDIEMPDMDGVEATRRLRATADTCRVPVLALTAKQLPGDVDEALESGCDGYIVKPLHPEELVDELAAYLGTLEG